MSHFKLRIETDNAAFYDDDGEYDPGPQIAELLKDVVRAIELEGDRSGSLHDFNGNRVGQWKIHS